MTDGTSYTLRLFVTGMTARSMRAISNLREILDEQMPNRFTVEVIDVLENPELAEREKIVATPALIKTLPPPVRVVIGDLSSRSQVLVALDLLPAGEPHDG